MLIEALADKWGVREATIGKAVWVELDTRPDGEPEIRRPDGRVRPTARDR